MPGTVEPTASARAVSRRVRVARSAEVRPDEPRVVSASGVDLVLLRTPAGLRAFQGRCPHQGALLGEGEVDGPTLVCRNHRWRFSVEDGRRQGGPQCLASHHVVEREGEVFVDVGEPKEEAGPSRGRRHLRDLPGPRGLPLLGNLLELHPARLHEVLEGWAAEYGPIYRYRVGPRWVVAVSGPELTGQVLRARPETYRRQAVVAALLDEMGLSGVFSAEGQAWRPQRRLTIEALSHRHLQGFYPTLRRVAERLRARWDEAARRGGQTDILDDLRRFTVDVTTLLALGHDLDTIGQGEDVIQRHLEQVFPAFNRRLFAPLPTWRLLRTAADRRLDHALGEVRTWLGGLVDQARARLAADPTRAARPANFLEAMVQARDDAGRPFSDDVLFGNLMTMLLAGEDTTANTLAWAVHHLCDSPPSVDALRREIGSALGKDAVPGDIETAGRLAYAGAVANEAMRLRPVAPVLLHEAVVDTVLGDVALPAGSRVAVLTRPGALAPESFAEPRAFRPERWLAAAPGAHDPTAHIPFGSGPRLCPGRTLALLEMKVVLAALYGSFDVEREGPPHAVREGFAFTMFPAGLAVRLRRRPQP